MDQRFVARIAEIVLDEVVADRALFRVLDGAGDGAFEASRGPCGGPGGPPGSLEAVDETIAICGQAPSDHRDLAAFLAGIGIDSISLVPDSLPRVARRLATV